MKEKIELGKYLGYDLYHHPCSNIWDNIGWSLDRNLGDNLDDNLSDNLDNNLGDNLYTIMNQIE